ncbi:NUDIX domain-containing protein [Amycolatopsis sp. NPDC050768]|uniref:NUDIX domain-containing protein n=1 Tax=Amycolatopsis sp. NPDC050768 TaxID=3154839 RepID=UPI0033EC7AA9
MSFKSLIGSLAAKIAAKLDDRDPVFYAADMVAFTLRDGVWHVLVIQRGWNPHKGKLALPGGHVDRNETSRDAAVRELAEETGIQVPRGTFVDQVGVWDDPFRDARGRYVSVAYSVVIYDAPDPVAADDAAAAEWMPVHIATRVADKGGFAFDHHQMLGQAMHHLHVPVPSWPHTDEDA